MMNGMSIAKNVYLWELHSQGYTICDNRLCKNAITFDTGKKHDLLCTSPWSVQIWHARRATADVNIYDCGLYRDEQDWKGVSPALDCCYHCTEINKSPCAGCKKVINNYTLSLSWNGALGQSHSQWPNTIE